MHKIRVRHVGALLVGAAMAVGTYGVILRGYQVTPRQFLPHLVRARSSAYPAPR